ncbi:YqaJ viral recombinase family nuclease [Mesorhizobium neociceri]|uniref:YqaJ viral recombinase family protein n=1 Tax=Mesorhizobium neociceri TaxID=1307853 RepID=A0A838B533_9HYPH|nr:YqaJ viral recombinase family protein [Mesorhizobium neociceri]MBA1141726.1 YqaJ viral recombinase family protein [Mesorhizobium neociceri]
MTIQIIRPADRQAWLAARQQDVTASVAAAVIGAHPYTTPYALFMEKTGRLSPDDEETEAMERGNLMEPVVVALIRKRFPEWTVIYENDRAYYRDPARRIGATPDAFVDRPDRAGTGNCQIKTASEDAFKEFWLDPDTGEVVPPTWIAVQAITEAQLTGCAWACVALVVITWRGTFQLHIVDIPIHLRLWNRLIAKVGDFWTMVASGEEPEPDWQRDGEVVMDVYRDSMPGRRDLTGDDFVDATVADYRACKEAAGAATKRADILRPIIIRALGNAEIGLTANWEVSARTTHRSGSQSRVLRIKPRRDLDAASF